MVLVSLMKLYIYKSYEIFVLPLFREVLNFYFVKSQVFIVTVTIPQNVYWLQIVSYWKGPLKNSSLSGLSVTVVLNDISHKMIQLKYAVALPAMCVDPNRDN